MRRKSPTLTHKQKPRLGMFLSLAITISLITPFMPAALSAGRVVGPAATPRATTHPAARSSLAVAPLISATKTDAFPDPDNDGNAAPGTTITYTVQITNSGTDATGVVFTDTVDANTTFVPGSIMTTPVAVDDNYSAIGNVQINVPAADGLTDNDSDPDGDTLTASGPATSANGGNVSVNADGSFTYNPPPGFEGTDTFTYTVTDGDGPPDSATVTINVAGMIWFIDDSAGSGGDGRLTSPFNDLTGPGSFDAVAADQQNDNIFLYSGNYTGGLALQSGQALIGQGASASLATITGLTPPPYSDPLPATGGSNPVIGGTSGISIATNNLIRGVTIANTAGTGISGSGFGTLAVAETTVNSTGQALNLDNGLLQTSFQSLSSTSSGTTGISLSNIAVGSVFSGGPTSVSGATGVGISLSNIGSGSVSFGATDVLSRNATGIDVDNAAGTVAFGATNIPNPSGAGGYGIRMSNSSAAVSFAGATISDANVTVAQVDTTPADGLPDNDGDGDAIFLKNNTGSFSVGGGALSNCGNDCVDARESSNVVLTNVAISFPGVDVASPTGLGVGGHGFYALNLTGTNGLSGGSVSNFNGSNRDGVLLVSNMFTQTFNVAGTTFQNATGTTGIRANASGTANVTLNVGGATNNAATNVTFDNLTNSAINASTTGTSTLTATVQNSTFSNAPINGKNNIIGNTTGTGHGSFNVLNNTFNNVGRTASTGEGLINLTGNATLVGNTFSANVSGNTISNVGGGTSTCGSGATFCAGPINTIVIAPGAQTNVSGTILVDGNHLTSVQQGGLLLDMFNAGGGLSPIAAKITNNVFGTNAARVGIGAPISAGYGMRVQRRTDGSPSANVLISGNSVRNGNGAAGSALNSPGIHLRTQNTASMDVTATGNDIDTNFTGVTEMRVETSNVGSVLCLDASGNTFPAVALAVLELRETAGALNVEQANSAALSAANGGVTVTTAAGTPNFGIACAAPVASLRLNTNREHLAALNGPAAKAMQGFSYLSEVRSNNIFEVVPALDIWAPSSKLRFGGLSFRYAAEDSRLLSDFSNAVVWPSPTDASSVAIGLSTAVVVAPAFSGETITVNIGTLPAGKSMTIKFQVTIDNPINATQVSNQGTVSGSNFSPVLTDDPTVGGTADPTVTPVGTPPTIDCPDDIITDTDPGQYSASVSFTVTATGTPNPTVDCKIGATSITSPHTFPVGTTTVVCTASNGVGSPASCSFNVTVNDNEDPTISCPANITTNTEPGSCEANVNVGSPTYSDNDPNVTVNGTRSDSQPLNAPYPKGTTTITWTATDTAGNSASCQQTVTVNDGEAPVITVNGPNPMTVECGSAFNDPGATATDNCGGSIPVNATGTVDVNTPGTYTIYYNATDASGNAAVQKTRTVNVVDTTKPVITVNGPNPMTVECGSTFNDPGATASDSCDTNVPVTTSGSVNTSVPGTYTLTYNATDDSGNQATPKTRTVIVVDTGLPVININGQTYSLWPANHKYKTFNVTDFVTSVSDGCNTSLGVSSVVIQKVTSDEIENGNGDGNTLNDIVIAANCKSVQLRAERDGSGNGRVYTIIFSVTDSSGNTATATAKVVVPHNPGSTPVDSGPHYTVNGTCP